MQSASPELPAVITYLPAAQLVHVLALSAPSSAEYLPVPHIDLLNCNTLQQLAPPHAATQR